MKDNCTIAIAKDAKMVSIGNRETWRLMVYAKILTGGREIRVTTEKMGIAVEASAVPWFCKSLPQEVKDMYAGGWLMDKRVVATIAKMVLAHWSGEASDADWPGMGDDIPMLSEEEAEAYLKEQGIPRNPALAREIAESCDVLTDSGYPDWM